MYSLLQKFQNYFFQKWFISYIPTNNAKDFRLLCPPTNVGSCPFKTFSLFCEHGIVSHLGFNLHPLLTNDVKHSFMCLFAICIAFEWID